MQTGIWGRRSSGSVSGWSGCRPEYLRLPALIHEGLTQQMPDYAAAVWRLEGMLGRGLSEALDEAAFITAYAALGLPGEGKKVKGVSLTFTGDYHDD